MVKINEKQFGDLLYSKLSIYWDRALTVFQDYGPILGYHVTNVLLHASDKKKIKEVLDILEEHYHSHLRYEHPDIQGIIFDNLLIGANLTQVMFINIYRLTLRL